MDDPIEDLELGEKRLCSHCVGDRFLQSEIRNRGVEGTCSYCGDLWRTFTIEVMADEVQTALDEHYRLASSEPTPWQEAMLREGDLDFFEPDGEPIATLIESFAGIPPAAASDIREYLSESKAGAERARLEESDPFDEEAHYLETEVSDSGLWAGWDSFEDTIKKKARYCSRTTERTLHEIFGEISGHRTADGRPVIFKAGPGHRLIKLFRARVFQSPQKLKQALESPDNELGPPPTHFATAGRMNSRGIAVFYGATQPLTALAEVRPPVGSSVAVALFEITRPLQLLDIDALQTLNAKGSVFDPAFKDRLQKAAFLKRLSYRMTRPVMPDDEPFEYLATQVIADYLANDSEIPLDGLIYRSVQRSKGQKNVVLFHKAARVAPVDLPTGTKVSARLSDGDDDGWGPTYHVWEEAPAIAPPDPIPPRRISTLMYVPPPELSEYDDRETTLRLDLTALKVYHVRGISFEKQAFPVQRLRTTVTTPASPADDVDFPF